MEQQLDNQNLVGQIPAVMKNDVNVDDADADDDKFPEGLRVLLVDDNPVCLKVVEGFLRRCHYKVTTTREAKIALDLLRENKNNFDIVITDVQMSEMDGFKLLEIIGLEMDIPVIMISSSDDQITVRKGIEHGACDYLVKPVRIGELQNIWQHVIRKTKLRPNNVSGSSEEATNQNTKSRKRQNDDSLQGNENDANVSPDDHELIAAKKQRVNWTKELHTKFVTAFYRLGADNAVPSKILEEMNVPDLTREKVASHLQKYRNGLKKNGRTQEGDIGVSSSMMEGNLPNATMPSFDSKGRSGVDCFNGLRVVDVQRNPQTIQYGHHGWNPNASTHPYGTPRPHHMNQQYMLPPQRPLSFQLPSENCQRIQVHEPSNSMTTDNFYRQMYPNNSQSFSTRSRLYPGYMDNSFQMLDYSAGREPRSSSVQVLGCRSNSLPVNNSLAFAGSSNVQNDPGILPVQNPLSGTNEGRDLPMDMQTLEGEDLVSIDQIPSVEFPLDPLETGSFYPLSSCNSTDEDLSAAIKQFRQ